MNQDKKFTSIGLTAGKVLRRFISTVAAVEQLDIHTLYTTKHIQINSILVVWEHWR